MATPIITDGTQERVIDAPRVVLAADSVFEERASRFAALASGHAMGEFLKLMARVASAQASALAQRSAPVIDDTTLSQSREYGMPPLAAPVHERDPQWRADLADIATRVGAEAPTPAMELLRTLSPSQLEALADRVLQGETLDEDAALVPFVGAALQVYFTRRARTLPIADIEHFDVPTVCPVCATRPVASVVRIGGKQANRRYLVCALCSTEWNMARIQCTVCEEDKSLKYLMIDMGDGRLNDASVRAEACDECKTYLKVLYQERDPQADPTADDLATLALDLLVDEKGYARSGPNLLFHPGSG